MKSFCHIDWEDLYILGTYETNPKQIAEHSDALAGTAQIALLLLVSKSEGMKRYLGNLAPMQKYH